jgi:hypothetical protein
MADTLRLDLLSLNGSTLSATMPVEYEVYDLIRRKIPSLLFYVSCENDASICVYEALRKENELVDACVSVYRTTLTDTVKNKKSIPGFFYRKFFELKVTTEMQEGKKAYFGRLAGFSSRLLRLRLKKEFPRVTLTTTMHATWEGKPLEIQNAELYNVRLQFKEAWKPNQILMFGRATTEDVWKAMKEANISPLPQWNGEKVIYIIENVPITDDMQIAQEDVDKED